LVFSIAQQPVKCGGGQTPGFVSCLPPLDHDAIVMAKGLIDKYPRSKLPLSAYCCCRPFEHYM
jgi:hypothetical protein